MQFFPQIREEPELCAWFVGRDDTMKLLYTGILPGEYKKRLSDWGIDCIGYGYRDLMDEVAFIRALEDKAIYINGGDEYLSKRVIESAKNLRLVVFMGTGYESYVDVDAATRKGIPVCSTPGANSEAVSEFTIGLMLSLWRRIVFFSQKMKNGEEGLVKTRNLRGKTLGIIGLGIIGSQVARTAAVGLGMNVIYWSRRRKINLEKLLEIRWREFEALLGESDVITIHAGINKPGEKAIIGKHELALMKNEAILINTARPHMVDGIALYEALVTNRLAGAAMDGFYPKHVESESDKAELNTSSRTEALETEKHEEDVLLSLESDKFIATPHVAWFTHESDRHAWRIAVSCIADIVIERGHSDFIVNPDYKKYC